MATAGSTRFSALMSCANNHCLEATGGGNPYISSPSSCVSPPRLWVLLSASLHFFRPSPRVHLSRSPWAHHRKVPDAHLSLTRPASPQGDGATPRTSVQCGRAKLRNGVSVTWPADVTSAPPSKEFSSHQHPAVVIVALLLGSSNILAHPVLDVYFWNLCPLTRPAIGPHRRRSRCSRLAVLVASCDSLQGATPNLPHPHARLEGLLDTGQVHNADPVALLARPVFSPSAVSVRRLDGWVPWPPLSWPRWLVNSAQERNMRIGGGRPLCVTVKGRRSMRQSLEGLTASLKTTLGLWLLSPASLPAGWVFSFIW